MDYTNPALQREMGKKLGMETPELSLEEGEKKRGEEAEKQQQLK